MAGNQKTERGHKFPVRETAKKMARKAFMAVVPAVSLALTQGCGRMEAPPQVVRAEAQEIVGRDRGYIVEVPIDCGPIDNPTTTPTERVYEETDEYGNPITKTIREVCEYKPPVDAGNDYGNGTTGDTGYGDGTTGDAGGSGETAPAYPWQGTAAVGVGESYALPVSGFSIGLDAIDPTTITFNGGGATYSREVTPSALLFFSIGATDPITFEVRMQPNGNAIEFSWRVTDTPATDSYVFTYPTNETNIAGGEAAIIGDYYITFSIIPDGNGGDALYYETRAATDMSLITQGVVAQEGTIYGEGTAMGRVPVAYVNSVNDALDNAAVVPFAPMVPVTSAGTRTTETTQQQLMGDPVTTEIGYRREVTDTGAYLVYYNRFSSSISNDVNGVPVTNQTITFSDPQGNTWLLESYDPVSNTITASKVLATGIIGQNESITATVETAAGVTAEIEAKLVDVRNGIEVYDFYVDGVRQEVQTFGNGDRITINIYGTEVTLSTRAALQEGQGVPTDSAQVALVVEEKMFVNDTVLPDGSTLRIVKDSNENVVAVEFLKKE